jgi:glucose/arabinose dehydrogenase
MQIRNTACRPWLLGATVLILFTCSGGGGNAPTAQIVPSQSTSAPPAPASVSQSVEVPADLAATPFDQAHSLNVPPGFGIRVWARVAGARFLARAPNGDILVSQPGQGKITLLRKQANASPQMLEFATGLSKPHGMVFHQIGTIIWLYVAESNRITRSVYQPGMTTLGQQQVVVDNLPDNSTPELRGAYSHDLKNIALGPDDKLYVSIASACNACAEDTISNPVRGAIYQYGADGSNGRLFARGLRNAEGLDFIPGTNTLWAAVADRDNILVSQDLSVNGDGQNNIGQLVSAYVDNNPPDPFTVVTDGANYGWPFCRSVPNDAMSNLDVLPDFELNPKGIKFNCATVTRASKGIRAHATPLGFSFLHGSNVPAAYRSGAAVALHGCWNCTTLIAGYKVVYFPFDAAGNAGNEIDLVTGFVTDPVAGKYWGRPVDVIAGGDGDLLISDDLASAIYQLYPLTK